MSYVHILVIVSAFISIAGVVAYIRDILTGWTKPNLVSWSMWATVAFISSGAAIFAHADLWATARVFLAGCISLSVVLCSLMNKRSYWKLGFFDGLCWVFSVMAIVAWLIVESPQLAILLAVIWNIFAGLPTIVKTWKNPNTETGATYIASFVSVLIILPSIPVWNIENSAFQICLLTVNTILVVGVYRKMILNKIRKT